MAFQTALSGLNAATADLNVTGNNIANVSTVGFKKSRAEFVDVYAASYQGISRLVAGSGARVSQIQQQFAQGNIEYTDNNLDLAVSGKGFFVMSDNGAQVYTRQGQFFPDDEGYIINSQNMRLQAFPYNNVSQTYNTGVLQDLQLATGEGPPSATTNVEVGINLDADSTVINQAVTPLDPTDPTTYTYSTAATVYDSLGSSHQVSMYYVKTNTNTWNVYAALSDTVDTVATAPGVAGDSFADPQLGPGAAVDNPSPVSDATVAAAQQPIISGPITVGFTPNGSLDYVGAVGNNSTVSYRFAIDNGATGNNTALAPNYFDFTMDYTDATQYSRVSGVNALSQDGYGTGILTGVDIDDKGIVFARYTNGLAQPLGKVAMATFANPQGLQNGGNSIWVETSDAGTPVIGEAGSANLGLIQSGAVEASNVNLSKELVNLIIAQRNFQANAQAITTENQVQQTIINIR